MTLRTRGTDDGTVSLLTVDDEVAAAVPQAERRLAHRLARGRRVSLPPGPVAGLEGPAVWAHYVTSGVLMRCVSVGRVTVPELLGPGDVIVPSTPLESTLGIEEAVVVIEPAELVTLDDAFARAAGRWPPILAVLAARGAKQRLRAGAMTAIAHLSSADLRILASFWHLADTWGRVGVSGTIVPFPFTHEAIGRLVGARRPTISLAISALEKEGVLRRLDDGTWLLAPGSDEVLRARLGADDGDPPAVVVRARVLRRQAQDLAQESAAVQAQAEQAWRRREADRES